MTFCLLHVTLDPVLKRYFVNFLNMLCQFVKSLVIEMPRLIGQQRMCSNVPSSTPEEYFRHCVFLPFFEAFTEQIDETFVKHKSILTKFEILFSSSLSLLPGKDDENAMRILCKSYSSHVGDSVLSAVGEIYLWYSKLQKLEKCPMSPLEGLESCPGGIFSVTQKLLQIMATLPVAASTSERSFSTLRCLESYLRSTIGALRLDGLAFQNIHREVPLSPEEILGESATKPRRLGCSCRMSHPRTHHCYKDLLENTNCGCCLLNNGFTPSSTKCACL